MFKQLIFLSIVILAAVARTTTENLESYTFEQYREEYGKVYDDAELPSKHRTFYKNMATIIENNKIPGNQMVMGVNDFTDLNEQEFSKYKGKKYQYREQEEVLFLEQPANVPSSKDWRNTPGVVSPVKNQGGCGSCWAFSATESIESAIALAKGETAPVLAPQELVDCTPNPQQCGGTGGCQGATEQLGFIYAIGAGMTLNSDYPYVAQNQQCAMSTKTVAASISSYVNVTSNNKNALLKALQVGPVSVSVDASWQFYSRGVYSSCNKDAVIDHAVQAVGYDMTDSNNMYWIVRNSWGESWGDNGYINLKMYADDNQKCGTDSSPASGSGCKGGPSSVTVCGECGILYDNSYPVV